MATEKLSALEQFALKGILELDIARSTARYGFPSGGSYVRESATKPDEVYKAVRALIEEDPKVVEEVAHYLLADNSYYLNSVRVVRAVSLLKEIGKSGEDIAQRVVESIKGETAYHTIERYHIRLGNRYHRDGGDNLIENDPKMYGKVMNRLTDLITPDFVLEAIAGLRGKDEEYARGDFFKSLCRERDIIQNVINDQNAPQRKYLAHFVEEMRRRVKSSGELIAEKSGLIYDMLRDFSEALGYAEFQRKGYTSINSLQEFDAEVKHILWDEIDKNLQQLSQQLEKQNRPWYRKLLGEQR